MKGRLRLVVVVLIATLLIPMEGGLLVPATATADDHPEYPSGTSVTVPLF